MAHSLSPTLLILAISGRALAQSARRAGFAPLVADFFADRDTREAAAGWVRIDGDLADGFQPDAVMAALYRLEQQAPSPPIGLVYGAGLEAEPSLIAEIAARWPVLGNDADTVSRVKDPRIFFGALDKLGIAYPEVRCRPEVIMPPPPPSPASGRGSHDARAAGSVLLHAKAGATSVPSLVCGGGLGRGSHSSDNQWLLKRTGGAGGSHIKPLDGDAEIPIHTYAQLLAEGRAMSALILSDDAGTRVLGFSEQWASPAPGRPFRYGGAVQPAEISTADERAMDDIASHIGNAFGLRGLGSVDFILTADGPLMLEVNPRPGATLDIFDSAALPLLALHVAACGSKVGASCVPSPACGGGTGRGKQPRLAVGHPPPQPSPASGRGSSAAVGAPAPFTRERANASHIVFAPQDLVIPRGMAWPDWTADRPHDGETISAERPVCTVNVQAASPAAARALAAMRESVILESIQKPPASCRKV